MNNLPLFQFHVPGDETYWHLRYHNSFLKEVDSIKVETG